MTQDRVQYNEDRLDEIVVEGCTVHLEAMDAHRWMLRIWRPALKYTDGPELAEVDVHLSVYDVFEVEDPSGLPVTDQGPLAICHEWKTRDGRSHYCRGPLRIGSLAHKRHICDCGSWRPA